MSDEREIIEVEDYRVIDVREEPLDDSEPPLPSNHRLSHGVARRKPIPPQSAAAVAVVWASRSRCC